MIIMKKYLEAQMHIVHMPANDIITMSVNNVEGNHNPQSPGHNLPGHRSIWD